MHNSSFDDTVSRIVNEDGRYGRDAYTFVRLALDHTVRTLATKEKCGPRHVTGQELLEGIRECAIAEFGPTAKRVLNTWGITRTEDFGEIVFQLVEKNKLGTTGSDRKEDFANGYDFDTVFVEPFKPRSRGRRSSAGGRGRRRSTRSRGTKA